MSEIPPHRPVTLKELLRGDTYTREPYSWTKIPAGKITSDHTVVNAFADKPSTPKTLDEKEAVARAVLSRKLTGSMYEDTTASLAAMGKSIHSPQRQAFPTSAWFP